MSKPIASAREGLISVELAGFSILPIARGPLAAYLLERVRVKEKTNLFFANTNLMVQCAGISQRFRHPDSLMVNDGIGLSIAAKIFRNRSFPENLNGTDFVPFLLKQADRPLRVFLYGATSTSNKKAAESVSGMGHLVVGAIDGYQIISTEELVSGMAATQPDVVLVALGNPRQEMWVLDHADTLPPALFIGVGALFDFLAGTVPRAPQWVQSMRLEWLFRLSREPRRLWKRYTLDIFRFLALCSGIGQAPESKDGPLGIQTTNS
jgi:beta-1,4-glucosyltransferase